jgi:hypothetical protein
MAGKKLVVPPEILPLDIKNPMNISNLVTIGERRSAAESCSLSGSQNEVGSGI